MSLLQAPKKDLCDYLINIIKFLKMVNKNKLKVSRLYENIYLYILGIELLNKINLSHKLYKI